MILCIYIKLNVNKTKHDHVSLNHSILICAYTKIAGGALDVKICVNESLSNWRQFPPPTKRKIEEKETAPNLIRDTKVLEPVCE